MVLLSSFILPHALTVGTTTLAEALGETYPIIWCDTATGALHCRSAPWALHCRSAPWAERDAPCSNRVVLAPRVVAIARRFLIVAKLAASVFCWLAGGAAAGGAGAAGAGWLIMGTMILNRNITECAILNAMPFGPGGVTICNSTAINPPGSVGAGAAAVWPTWWWPT